MSDFHSFSKAFKVEFNFSLHQKYLTADQLFSIRLECPRYCVSQNPQYTE